MESISLQEEVRIRKDVSKLRREISNERSSEFLNSFNRIEAIELINSSILKPILERDPFENTLEKLSFSLFITDIAINHILELDLKPLEKISYANYIVEMGSREFLSPYGDNKAEKNLTAAKQCGYFFTPVSLSVKMVKLTFQDLQSKPQSIIDPASGIGGLLAVALICNPNLKSVTGIELDSFTSAISKKLIAAICRDLNINPEIKMLNKDFLNHIIDTEEKTLKNDYDLLIMNPPYGRVRFLKPSLTNKETKSGLSGETSVELENKLREETIKNAAELRNRFAPLGLGKGTPEYSKLFMALSTKVVKENGFIVAITPSSWLGDENGNGLREYLVENHGIMSIWNFKEAAKIFPGVNQPTTVIKLKVGTTVPTIEIQGPLSSVDEVGDTVEYLESAYIKKYSPVWFRIPLCGNGRSRILSVLHDKKPLSAYKEIINLRGELDLTAHKDLLKNSNDLRRLIRGDHVELFHLKSPEESDKKGFVEHETFISRMGKSKKLGHIKKWRIAVPQCSYMSKKKRIEACLVEPGMIIANSCNYITLEKYHDLSKSLLIILSIINSAVIEWRFRLFNSNNHVSNYEIDELPMFDINKENYLLDELSKFMKNPLKYKLQIEAIIALSYSLDLEDMKLILQDLNYNSDTEAIIDYMKFYMEKVNKNSNVKPNHNVQTLSDLDKQMISYVKPGGNWESIPETVPSKRLEQIREMSKKRGKVRTTYYGRLRPEQPSYTISTYFNRPGNGTNIHPWEDRTISCREAARLQSFPDDFVFCGSESAVRKQIGNAVPPLLGYALGKAIGVNTFIDLFSGAGGLSYGLELAGLKGLAALEIDKSAAETYSKNHSHETEVIVGDITKNEVQNKLLETVKNKGQTVDLIVGGPPCQGFSTAGFRNPEDERNALVTYYLKVVEELKPKYVLIENVEGLINMEKGKVLRSIQEVLNELGYSFYQDPWVLNAEQYGVPQMRKRVIIIAARKGMKLPTLPVDYFDKCKGRREKEIDRLSDRYPITVSEALLGLPNLQTIIKEYYPSSNEVNSLYSKWCEGKLSTQEFLDSRGKIISNLKTPQPLDKESDLKSQGIQLELFPI